MTNSKQSLSVGASFDWGQLGQCTVEVVRGTLVKFRASNGALYQCSANYWRRMAENVSRSPLEDNSNGN
jgi:hypothetical protein